MNELNIAEIASKSNTIPGYEGAGKTEEVSVDPNPELTGTVADLGDPIEQAEQSDAPASEAAKIDTIDSPWFQKFGEVSGLEVKSEDDVKNFVEQANTTRTSLEAQVAELQTKLNDNQFADSYERLRSEIKRSGGSKEQLKALDSLNEVGNLDELTPFDVAVKKRVLVDKMPEDIAKTIVAKKYDIDLDADVNDMSSEEKSDHDRKQWEMKSEVKADLEELKKFKVDVEASAVQQADNTKLQQEVQRQEILTNVKNLSPDLMAKYPGPGSFKVPVSLQQGAEPIAFESKFDVPKEYRDQIPSMMESYFTDLNKPVNEETLKEFLGYLDHNLKATYMDKIVNDAVTSAVYAFNKQMVEKNENHQGIKRKDSVGGDVNTEKAAMNKLADRIAGIN